MEQNLPFFSIIIAVYNREEFIKTAIQSVLDQTFQEFELIIIDDGSTDNTKKVINAFLKDENRISYYYQENSERSAARNLGITKCKGEWICFLDSDDFYLPNHLTTLHDLCKDIKMKTLIYVRSEIRSKDTVRHHPLINKSKDIIKEIMSKFLLMNGICGSKEIFLHNKFDERFSLWEDTHLWIRIASLYPVVIVNEITNVQVVHDSSSVLQGLKVVKKNQVRQYLLAIDDLKKYPVKISKEDLDQYKVQKIKMYLYQARQNRQLFISLWLWRLQMKQTSFIESCKDFIRIILNYLGIGL